MKTVIISLGGSIIVPDKINVEVLKNFKELILSYKDRFVIITGGGIICRQYQNALKEMGIEDNSRLDWIGISATKLNADLVRQLFAEHCKGPIITDPTEDIEDDSKILVASGYKPGWSTDYVAILLAKLLGSKTVINLSNIDYVYDKNPKEFKDAKPLKSISWDKIISIVGDEWSPGLNAPFDPIAAKLGKKNNVKVIIANGNNVKNLKNILDNRDFDGTTIE